jgi:competence protein ComEC
MKEPTTILKSLSAFLLKNIINILSVCIATLLFFKTETSSPEIVFLDVGQGDAILIQENSFQMLIDGGPDNTVMFEIGKYIDPRDKRIEIMVLTHPHADHIKGLLYVLEKYKVDEVWINMVLYDNSDYQFLLDRYGEKLRIVSLGDSLRYRDLNINVLYPFDRKTSSEEILGNQDGNINNESVVLDLRVEKGCGEVGSILLMGDAEKEVEEKLLRKGVLRKVNVLKAGHHCSKTASSECFLEVVRPSVGICSVGEGNRFGHPHSETLQYFKKYNVQYISTEESGNIVITF